MDKRDTKGSSHYKHANHHLHILRHNREKHKKTTRSSFTLIELLVVVAIIGFLASVILVVINDGRLKGSDAAVKANLNTVRSRAELQYDTWGGYGTVAFPSGICTNTPNTIFGTTNIWEAIQEAAKAGRGLSNTKCTSTIANYSVAVGLKSGGIAGDGVVDSWCVDSSGVGKSYAWAPGESISESTDGVTCN
ncbi:type II secretion system protein [Candidatus Nomurabacteria bacterium]|nr:type II secretion system protein [Candidatus Nomurabacteria bacterium]